MPETDVGAWCERLYPRLVGALGLHCRDQWVAEELAQETLARAWQHWADVRAMESPEAWAFRVAFNLAASRFRRLAAERRARARLGADEPAPPADLADVQAVRAAVAELPSRQRAALVLRYFADLSIADTAEILGCAPGTVKSLCSHALDHLRQHFAVDLDDDVDLSKRDGGHDDA